MLAALVQAINERHGTAFDLGGRFPDGEQGAYTLSEGVGGGPRRFVLKWEPGAAVADNLRQAVAITERIRTVGYPAPRYRFLGREPSLGVVYSVQEELPGTPLGARFDRPMLDRLLALNDLQRGQAGAAVRNWPRPVADPVLSGGEGFCLLDTMRSHSAATAAMLDVVRRLVADGMHEPSPADDVVHFDFTGANILVDGDRVTGVIDWDGWCAGDRAFDLATLLFYADGEPEQVERLWKLLVARSGPRLLGMYLGHVILRQVEWSIRFHGREAVDAWLGRADERLRRLQAEAGT